MLLVNNVTSFLNVFGVEEPDLVMTLATMPWKSEDDRDGFINEIVAMNNGQLYKRNLVSVR
jgi:hypothetical protein